LINHFNFSIEAANFILVFLHGRTQCTLMNGQQSPYANLYGGEPQGTVAGPKLFNIYINDLPSVVDSGLMFLYADDVQLLFSCKPHDC
jgi:hypothetical protein